MQNSIKVRVKKRKVFLKITWITAQVKSRHHHHCNLATEQQVIMEESLAVVFLYTVIEFMK